ncbi:MAG: hypothetical protein IVW52_05115 [Acidimicrobiales bacterium]|nr:hypothetical protein [Acidimicrobiales bacterium]
MTPDDVPAEARSCTCGCGMSFHNWGRDGFPRIMTVAETLSNICDSCGHPPEGPK